MKGNHNREPQIWVLWYFNLFSKLKNIYFNVKAQGGGIKFTKNTKIGYMIWYGICTCSRKPAFFINEDWGPCTKQLLLCCM